MMLTYVAICAIGLEKLVKNEVKRLGYHVHSVVNGAVTIEGPPEAIAVLNLNLRCAERIYLSVARFKATTFDELYDGIYQVDWQEYLRIDDAFPVDAKSQKSKLFSLSDIQSISKKAIAKKMAKSYDQSWFNESGKTVGIEVRITSDEVSVLMDTSGDALHKRGYRKRTGAAPLKETTAAALVLLSNWRGDDILCDPMCGSGTILIEAAMIVRGIAPGLGRSFAFENFKFINTDYLKNARKDAYQAIDYDRELSILGFDIDPKMIDIARENAENAGVDDCITFETQPLSEFEETLEKLKIISNPPYGERLSDRKSVLELYRTLGVKLSKLKGYSAFILTSNSEFEDAFSSKSDKNRKLYNGKIKCYFYQYYNRVN